LEASFAKAAKIGKRNDSVLPDPVPEVTTPGVPELTPRLSISSWCEYRGKLAFLGSSLSAGIRPDKAKAMNAFLSSSE
jgi:hypothetical protein